MLYELVTISCSPLELDAVSAAAHASLSDSGGRLLGAWRTELGELFQIRLMLAYESAEALESERSRTLLNPRPYGIEDPAMDLRIERYRGFSFLPDVQPAKFGRVYEFRTYHLKPGGLAPTLAGWEAAIDAARDYTKHLVTNMVALDGAPRITHIWGFASFEQRAELRKRHYANGSWPPKGGPQQIVRAISTICIPESYSPLR